MGQILWACPCGCGYKLLIELGPVFTASANANVPAFLMQEVKPDSDGRARKVFDDIMDADKKL